MAEFDATFGVNAERRFVHYRQVDESSASSWLEHVFLAQGEDLIELLAVDIIWRDAVARLAAVSRGFHSCRAVRAAAVLSSVRLRVQCVQRPPACPTSIRRVCCSCWR